MKILIFLTLLIAVACSPANDESPPTVSDSQSLEAEPPCDDEEAPKVEVSEEGINLLEDDEGCKLEN